MKRFLPLVAICALLLPVLQPANGADVSANFFYDNLSGGSWYDVADYGYVWQPDVATNSNWRPYTDGYWAYTDQGWTWVSYEDFGWATYHYGRWARLTDYGWVWVPGTEWGPAWVSWRTGGDYVGWAPLPPAGGGEVVYEGRPITGHVDVEFGIGPAYYNFVDVRYIGEPVLRDRIFDYNRNIAIIDNTVNVTNITYNNSVVYNYGPDYATVSRYSVRPIQRLKLERQNVDPFQAVKSGNVTKVQGNQLLVAAPMKLQKATGAQVAPKQVKAKIDQPKVEKGWANIDPNAKTKLEQKFKTENVKDIPKPNVQPSNANAGADMRANEGAGAATNAAAPAVDQSAKNKQKGAKAQGQAAAGAPAATAPSATEQGKGNKKNRGREERRQNAPAAAPATAAENQPENAGVNAGGEEKPGKRKGNNQQQQQQQQQPQQNVTPNAGPNSNAGGNEMKRNAQQTNAARENAARQNEARTRHNESQRQPEQRAAQERRSDQMQNAPRANQPGPDNGPGRQRHEQVQGNQAPPPRAEQTADQRKGKGKGKKNEAEATPSPR